MAITNSLPAYVEQNSDSLLRATLLGAESSKLFTLQTGVKTKTALNLLSTSIVLQDGSTCGFNAAGTSTLTQRTISAPLIKVNMEWCDKTLLNSALQHEVRVAAGQKTLPFEQDFINDVVDNVSLANERLVWQGDTSSTDGVLKWSDGLIKILTATDGITVASQKLSHSGIDDDSVISVMDSVIRAIPTEVLNDAVVFVGYDTFRTWRMMLQKENLYHYDGAGLDKGEAYYQGTNIKVKAVAGLNGTDKIVAGDPANFFFGTDLMNDDERYDLWFSKDDGVFKLAIEYSFGVQVAFPNQCVISYYVAPVVEE